MTHAERKDDKGREAARNAGARGDEPPRLPRMRGWVLAALGLFLFIFVAGGAWSYLTRIEGAVIAQGTVGPASGLKVVQHLEGGVVRKILVEPGDAVRAGEVLVVLDDSQLQASLAAVQAQVDAALAETARLRAERDGGEEVVFPVELRERAGVPAVRRIMEVQQALFQARRKRMRDQVKVLRQRVVALERSIEGLREELQGKEEQAKLVREEIETVRGLLARGQAVKTRLLALQRASAGLLGEQGKLRGQIAQARERITEIRLQELFVGKDFLAEVLDRLAVLQKEVAVLRERQSDLRRKLEETRIRAPVNGRVLDVLVRTIGGVVAPREPLMQIVPSDEPLVVEAQISPAAIDQVFPNQKARVLFSAFMTSSTPELAGRVRVLAPAPVVDELTRMPYYKAEIVVPPEELRRLGDEQRLVPGMPAEVFITTRAYRPIDVLLRPLLNAARRIMKET